MTFKVIDLFCGAGGLALGFVDKAFCGGFKTVLALDNNQAAIHTHNENFDPVGICYDIEQWLAEEKDIPCSDIVIGGPPCQGFSLLNKKRHGDERRSLWEPFMDIVKLSKASHFVIENVSGLIKSPEFEHIKHRASELNMDIVFSGILNAADFGTGQTRKRTIIIGCSREMATLPVFEYQPAKTHSAPGINDGLPKWKTVREAIHALPEPVGTDIRDCPSPLNLHFGRTPTPKSLARYKMIPAGGNRFDLQKNAIELTPQCWINKKSGGTDLFGRLWWDRPSVTIRTEFFKPEKGRYLHPDQHRPITHREAARLMGFPDSFVFKGSKIEIAKQIGNAVPPDLAGAIARVVRKSLEFSIKKAK